MLMASPGAGAKDAKKTPKDIVFVADTSGSMAEKDKIGQLKKALNFCLANLNDADRFNIVRFSTEAEPMFAELEHPTDERLKRARDFVDNFKPTGGTAIDDALTTALKSRQEKDRPFLIVFLTDGAPTIGTTNEDEIVKRAADRADGVRIFCFGIGHDVNTHLLDRIADETRAATNYVLPEEDIEVKVSSFFGKVKEPVMTNLKVAFGGDVRATQLYPSKLPDLFKGDTLLLFGRYKGSGASSVKITGTVEGKERDIAEDVKFVESDTQHAFIPRLWATRRVGWLLDEIRLHGESKELKDEVVELARKHGIVTPYTAYLIIEDESRRGVPEMSRTFREMESDALALDAAKQFYGSTVAESRQQSQRQGQQAIGNATEYKRLKEGWNEQQLAAAPAPALQPSGTASTGAGSTSGVAGRFGGAYDALSKSAATAPATNVTGYRARRHYGQQTRIVNGKAFYQNGNTWTDADVQRQALKRQRVRFNSDEYFQLARANAANAQWLSLGSEVDVVIGDTVYEIREN
jgi:Ca-activated chloride channel family protein